MANGVNNQAFNEVIKEELDVFSPDVDLPYKGENLAPYQVLGNKLAVERSQSGEPPYKEQLNKMLAETAAREEERKNWTYEDYSNEVHNKLLMFGVTPAWGNLADMADAVLYAAEGEWGSSGWALASAAPIFGQYVAGKRILNAAKAAGEPMVKIYRGVDKWYPGEMVRDGRFIGGGWESGHITKAGLVETYKGTQRTVSRNHIWTSESREFVEAWTNRASFSVKGRKPGIILEFEIPKSYYDEFFVPVTHYRGGKMLGVIDGGIPKEFLVNVDRVPTALKQGEPIVRMGNLPAGDLSTAMMRSTDTKFGNMLGELARINKGVTQLEKGLSTTKTVPSAKKPGVLQSWKDYIKTKFK